MSYEQKSGRVANYFKDFSAVLFLFSSTLALLSKLQTLFRSGSAFDKGAIKFDLSHPNWFSNCQSRKRMRSKNLKRSHRNEDGPIFLKTSAPYSLMTTFRMHLI